jgi:hypothetical protein
MSNQAYKHGKIDSLSSLRAEKELLRLRIVENDAVLKGEAEALPGLVVRNAMQEVTNKLRLSSAIGLAKSILGVTVKTAAGKSLLSGIASEAAVVGGIKLASNFFRRWRKKKD